MTAASEHTTESAADEALVAGIETVASLQRQLAACREELADVRSAFAVRSATLAALEIDRHKLRDTHRQVLEWMKQTDSATPAADIIKILEADLEATDAN